MIRENGFYWVRWKDDIPEVAQWSRGYWYLTKSGKKFTDATLTVISDRLPPPQ